jgi:hypothetical protein
MEKDRYQINTHSDYPTIPILTKVLTVIFCYCFYSSNPRIIHFLYLVPPFFGWGHLLTYYSDAEGPADCGSRVFIAEEGDGLGDKGQEITQLM